MVGTPITTPIRILIADDHDLFRDGLRQLITGISNFELLGEAANGQELIELARKLKPDVILTDIRMPHLDGIQAVSVIKEEFPDIQVIALTLYQDDELIVRMLDAGAKGYITKETDREEVIEAIYAVSNKKNYFSFEVGKKFHHLIANSSFNPYKKVEEPKFNEHELELMMWLCKGLSAKEIAVEMNASVRTVEGWKLRLQERLGLKNSMSIAIYAIKHNIIPVEAL